MYIKSIDHSNEKNKDEGGELKDTNSKNTQLKDPEAKKPESEAPEAKMPELEVPDFKFPEFQYKSPIKHFEDPIKYFETPNIQKKITLNPLANSYEKKINDTKNSSWWSFFDDLFFINAWKDNWLEEINKFKKTVKINTDQFDNALKEQIPYSIDEKVFEKLVTGLPTKTNNAFYWIETHKDNDKGEVKIQVLGKLWEYKSGVKKVVSQTELITEAKITGFKTFSKEQIIKERSVRIDLHTYNWLQRNERPKDRGYPESVNANFNNFKFRKTGSGFVIHKEKNLPIYYIATNKHVVNAITQNLHYQNEKYYYFHNLKEIGIQEDNEKVFVSATDALSHMEEKQNLKGWIGFADSEGKRIQQNKIKSIELYKDYSNPTIETTTLNMNQVHQYSLNEDLKTLTKTKDKKEFITLDMAIYKVEFNSENDSPYKEMWEKRPTKIVPLTEKNFFNDYRGGFDKKGKGVVEDLVNIGSFSSDQSLCWNNPNKEGKIKINQGINTIKPYKSDSKAGSILSQNAFEGRVIFDDVKDFHVGGASGSAIYNQNLNVVGILWGGSELIDKQDCDNQKKERTNLYTWISSNLTDDLFLSSLKNNKYNNIANYNYANFPE